MSSQAKKPSHKLLGYLDELTDRLRRLVPKALRGNNVDAIHDARVATRRLKAAIDLLKPVLEEKRIRPFARTLRKLRRKLGPLRDLDVIREHLTELSQPGDAARTTSIEWLNKSFDQQRENLLHEIREESTSNKTLAKLGSWWGLREQIKEADEAIPHLLRDSLRRQFEAFATASDALTNREGEVDPHAIRIAGKSLRYTLEMAEAQGLALGFGAARIFKKMQDALGLWHDYIVLTERMLTCSGDAQLAHHDAATQRAILALSQVTLKRSEKQLSKFAAQWSSHQSELLGAITPQRTDRGPSSSAEIPAPEAPPSDVPPAVSA